MQPNASLTGIQTQYAARSNYDVFGWSMITTFQVGAGGETWNEVLSTAIYAQGFKALAYFLPLYILGNYVLINLLAAVVIASVTHTRREMRKQREQQEESIRKEKTRISSPLVRHSSLASNATDAQLPLTWRDELRSLYLFPFCCCFRPPADERAKDEAAGAYTTHVWLCAVTWVC